MKIESSISESLLLPFSLLSFLTGKEAILISLLSHSKLASSFSRWFTSTQSSLKDLDLAIDHDENNLRRDAFDQWLQALNRKRIGATRAEVVHRDVLEKRYWMKWKLIIMERKLKSLRENKDKEKVVDVFSCEFSLVRMTSTSEIYFTFSLPFVVLVVSLSLTFLLKPPSYSSLLSLEDSLNREVQ